MNFKSLAVVFFLCCFITGTLFSQSTAPVDYMDSLFTPFLELDNEKWKYIKAMTRGKSARKIEAKRSALIQEYANVRKQLSLVKPYQDDDLLRPAVMDYLQLTQQVLKEDFGEIVDLEEIAEESFDGMEAYLLAQERANEKLNQASINVDNAMNEFAALNKIIMEDGPGSKLTDKIEKGASAMNYYNTAYLLFFKAFHQETYVFDAISRGDIGSLEQSANSLSSFAEEGLATLKEQDLYNGDPSLKIATRSILSFIKRHADKEYPALTDFLILQDELTTANKKLEAKKQKDRTEEEVNSFNNMVKEYNSGLKDFNKNLDALNKDRNNAIKEYNDAIQTFFDKHTK